MNLLDFDLPIIILSQTFGILALIIYFITNQQKSKKSYLLLMELGGVFNIIMLAMLQMWLLALFSIISFVRNIAFYLKDARKDTISLSVNILLLIIFWAATVIITIFTAEIWFEWIAMAIFMLHIFGLWYKGIHWAKLSDMIYCICLVILNVFVLNIMGIIIAANTIVSVVIFYIMLLTKKDMPPFTPTPENDSTTYFTHNNISA